MFAGVHLAVFLLQKSCLENSNECSRLKPLFNSKVFGQASHHAFISKTERLLSLHNKVLQCSKINNIGGSYVKNMGMGQPKIDFYNLLTTLLFF